jgi:hypothetical protein
MVIVKTGMKTKTSKKIAFLISVIGLIIGGNLKAQTEGHQTALGVGRGTDSAGNARQIKFNNVSNTRVEGQSEQIATPESHDTAWVNPPHRVILAKRRQLKEQMKSQPPPKVQPNQTEQPKQ